MFVTHASSAHHPNTMAVWHEQRMGDDKCQLRQIEDPLPNDGDRIVLSSRHNIICLDDVILLSFKQLFPLASTIPLQILGIQVTSYRFFS